MGYRHKVWGRHVSWGVGTGYGGPVQLEAVLQGPRLLLSDGSGAELLYPAATPAVTPDVQPSTKLLDIRSRTLTVTRIIGALKEFRADLIGSRSQV